MLLIHLHLNDNGALLFFTYLLTYFLFCGLKFSLTYLFTVMT